MTHLAIRDSRERVCDNSMQKRSPLRLYGVPEQTVAAVCPFPSIKAAVDTTIQVIQSGIQVARIEFLDEHQMDACNKYSDLNYDVAPTLFVEFHGSEQGIESQAEFLGEIARDNGRTNFLWEKEFEKRQKLWKARHNAYYACLAIVPDTKGYITDVCVPISKLPDVVVETRKDMDECGLLGTMCGHVGDGNFHCFLVIDPDNADDVRKAKAFGNRLGRRALAVGGTCTGEQGIGRGKVNLLERKKWAKEQ
ncbi:probable D-lactate dehydrogenase, mitochondrial [Oscarella lobularis]|uniref:probable D-lactate dehydrogenase, mitochondrial n=1 Tax=Oscarella lobularis TaxID=121494 RepID=UPI0033133F34